MSDTAVSDSDKRDGGPMRYVRHQRSRNRLQDEEPKINSQKTLDAKNVNLLFYGFLSIYINFHKLYLNNQNNKSII